MALGFEGYVQIGITVALGTGASVPRARSRIESSSGFGGKISGAPINEMGIGTPRTYGWIVYDGSVDMELNRQMIAELLLPTASSWLFDRQSPRDILYKTRKDSEQSFEDVAFWNSIGITAAEGSAITSSVAFVALDRTTYAYGAQGLQGFYDNKQGFGLLCPLGINTPTPLNAPESGRQNINPIPFWNTKITVGSTLIDFTNWSLDFSQDVVKFFGCTAIAGPQEPLYLAVGPMTATFSGAYMFSEPLADSIAQLNVTMDNIVFKLKKLENTSVVDAMPGGDSLVPLTVEYGVYDLDQT